MAAPGAVPLGARALAPDVARGAMLLLIALANVHLFLHDRPLGVRLYPAGLMGADRVVAAVQLALVDGRAYPLFGLLFGYGIGQLAARRLAAGVPRPVVVRTVRRRGRGLVVIGVAHALLLWSGDIVSAYGLIALVFAGMLVAGTAVSLGTTAAVGLVVAPVVGAFAAFSPPGARAPLASVGAADPVTAAAHRVLEWAGGVVLSSVLSLVGAVALGAWAARYRLLDEPARHRPLLGRVAVAGLAVGVASGVPLGLAAIGVWRPGLLALMLIGALHTLGGYAGGLGYAAAFGLLAARTGALATPGDAAAPGAPGAGAPGAGATPPERAALSSEPIRRECRSSDTETGTRRPGRVIGALAACGRRSLSCYLGQSVLFVALLPAWTLGLGARLTVAQAALVGLAVWLVLLLLCVAADRAGYRGPAEVLLRRLTYGRAAPSR